MLETTGTLTGVSKPDGYYSSTREGLGSTTVKRELAGEKHIDGAGAMLLSAHRRSGKSQNHCISSVLPYKDKHSSIHDAQKRCFGLHYIHHLFNNSTSFIS